MDIKSKIYISRKGEEKKPMFTDIETGEDIRYKFAATFHVAYTGESVDFAH